MRVRPVKTQISLGICLVWSESSLSAWRKLGSLATECVAKHLIRLGCAGWSESSLGAHSFVGFLMSCLILSCVSKVLIQHTDALRWAIQDHMVLWFTYTMSGQPCQACAGLLSCKFDRRWWGHTRHTWMPYSRKHTQWGSWKKCPSISLEFTKVLFNYKCNNSDQTWVFML